MRAVVRAARSRWGDGETVPFPLMGRRAVFPGSFDPLTVAHLAIAECVRDELGVAVVDLVISRVALAKEDRDTAPVRDRLAAIRAVRRNGRPWLGARVTEAQLLADIAEGYDVLVVGADKWHQLHDVSFYGGSEPARDAALRRLPLLAVAPRAGVAMPEGADLHSLSLPDVHRQVSSTAVRGGREEWRARPGR